MYLEKGRILLVWKRFVLVWKTYLSDRGRSVVGIFLCNFILPGERAACSESRSNMNEKAGHGYWKDLMKLSRF